LRWETYFTFSADDVIRLLITEIPRLTGEFSFSYSYRMAITDHKISGAGAGYEDALMLQRHLEKYKPEHVEFQLALH
jgi:hypothetical protein